MSFSEKLRARINIVKEEAEQQTKNLIELVKVEEYVRTDRLNICLSCEHLFKPTENCKKCGCFVQAKTWLKQSKCPIKKW